MLDATPLLRLYSRFRLHQLARQDAVGEQRRLLVRLIRRAAATRFGSDHNLTRVRTVEDYQSAVPLRCYDDFWQSYWQPSFPRLDGVTWPGVIPYFANSSGTTSGVTKHIPLSAEMMAANRRAAIDQLGHHVANRRSRSGWRAHRRSKSSSSQLGVPEMLRMSSFGDCSASFSVFSSQSVMAASEPDGK